MNEQSTEVAVSNGIRDPKRGTFIVGNPGRQKGARNKLGEEFIQRLHEDFQEHGVEAIQRCREDDPTAYVKVIASLLPRELKIDRSDDLTDEQRSARIRELAAALGTAIGASFGDAPGTPRALGSPEAEARPN